MATNKKIGLFFVAIAALILSACSVPFDVGGYKGTINITQQGTPIPGVSPLASPLPSPTAKPIATAQPTVQVTPTAQLNPTAAPVGQPTAQPTAAPAAVNKTVSLRYDNAGCVTNDGLASGQTKTVAWWICNSKSPSEAWIAIQAEQKATGAEVITAPAGTEMTQALSLGTAYVVWNSTCPTGKPKVDVSLPSANLPGPGCIRFVPEFGAGDRTVSFEQAIAVH